VPLTVPLYVSLFQAVPLFWKRWNDFSGRSTPSEYWWAWFGNYALIFVSTFILGLIVGLVAGPDVAGFADFIGGVVLLVVIVPSLAVTVRRLHDTGKSAWFLLLVIVPIVGLVLMVLPSDRHANKYGPAPVRHP
jgi:uncharacterized membrane protein YhaH (DUF805 family)